MPLSSNEKWKKVKLFHWNQKKRSLFIFYVAVGGTWAGVRLVEAGRPAASDKAREVIQRVAVVAIGSVAADAGVLSRDRYSIAKSLVELSNRKF